MSSMQQNSKCFISQLKKHIPENKHVGFLGETSDTKECKHLNLGQMLGSQTEIPPTGTTRSFFNPEEQACRIYTWPFCLARNLLSRRPYIPRANSTVTTKANTLPTQPPPPFLLPREYIPNVTSINDRLIPEMETQGSLARQGLLKTLGHLFKEGHKLLTDINMYQQKGQSRCLALPMQHKREDSSIMITGPFMLLQAIVVRSHFHNKPIFRGL